MPQTDPEPLSPRRVAESFARALDEDDFDAAVKALAPECQYAIGDKVLHGPDAIIQSYREGSDKAKRLFDRVEYGSELVEVGTNRVLVEFWDRLQTEGHIHTYRLKQHLAFGENGRIVRIQHEEIPGEREALKEFMYERGISDE